MGSGVICDPEVIGIKTGLFVVGVRMVAENHADAGVDDLGRHAVAILIGHPRFGVPRAAMKLAELRHPRRTREFLSGFAGRRNQAHRDRVFHTLNDIGIATLVVPYDAGRGVLIFLVDTVDIGLGRLHDVRVR